MRRVVLAIAVLAAAVAATGDAHAMAQTSFAFGLTGGNIIPYTVTISASGVVRTVGPVSVGRKQLRAKQLATLRRLVLLAHFASLPKTTLCAGVLPDFASTFIRVGTRRVLVHGDCVTRYAGLWLALSRAVALKGMS
jgi:hypothetical protein